MELIACKEEFSIVKLARFDEIDFAAPTVFFAKTADELSLVCETAYAPKHVRARDDGWRAFRVAGTLDFSLTGILAGIADVLRDAGVGIFAVSTFDTDYILTKAARFDDALCALGRAGYAIRQAR